LPPNDCTVTTRPCRCSPRERRLPLAYGRMYGMTGRLRPRPTGGNVLLLARSRRRASGPASGRLCRDPPGRCLWRIQQAVRGRSPTGVDHRGDLLGASMDRPWSARQKYGAFGRLRSCAAIHSAWCRGALAAGPDDIRSSVPYHWCGLRVRCAQRVRRSSVRPDLPSMPVLPSHSPRDGSAYAASALLVGWN
jgi:hypothetical protein